MLSVEEFIVRGWLWRCSHMSKLNVVMQSAVCIDGEKGNRPCFCVAGSVTRVGGTGSVDLGGSDTILVAFNEPNVMGAEMSTILFFQ